MALDKSRRQTKDRTPPCSHHGLSLFSRRVMVSPISLRPGRTLSLSEISKGKIREILVAAPRADVHWRLKRECCAFCAAAGMDGETSLDESRAAQLVNYLRRLCCMPVASHCILTGKFFLYS